MTPTNTSTKQICCRLVYCAVFPIVLLTGCASVAVTDDAIKKQTVMALGIPESQFVISDRVNNGVKSSYSVKTNEGKQYSCYVTGTVSYLGRVVSDAMCSEMGKRAGSLPAATTTGGTCNALLKAAGKC